MSEKTLSDFRAQVGSTRAIRVGYGPDIPAKPGIVELKCFADWLKGKPQIGGDLTPRQARQLAVALLLAAERAEEAKP